VSVMPPKKYNNLVLLLLWSIAVLYLLAIDLKGVWTDEGMRFILLSGGQTWQQFNHTGSFGSSWDVLRVIGPAPYQPLFYLVDNAVIRMARSHSDVLLRMVNLLWLMLSLQGLLRLFRAYDELTRLFAVVIFALNGYMLMHVMQIREYPMYVAFMIWSSCIMFELLEAPEAPSLRHWWPKLLGYGVLMALLFYSHPYSIFALAAQVVMVFTKKDNRGRFVRVMAVSYGTALILAAPWLVMVYERTTQKAGMGSWDTRRQTLSLLISSLNGGFRNLLTYGVSYGHPLMQVFTAVIVLGIPAAWITIWRRKERQDSRSVYALLTMLLFAFFQVGYFFLKDPLSIWGRYFIAYFYGYTVLATCAFAVLRRLSKGEGYNWTKALGAAVFLLVCAAGLAQYNMYREDPFSDTGMTAQCNWRVTSREMSRYVRPDDTVVYYHPLLAWTMSIYYPFNPNELSFDDIYAGNFGGKSALWLLDTGVLPDDTKRAFAHLQSSGYTTTKTVELGCQCKLFRLEKEYGVGSGPADPPPPNATVLPAASVRAGNAILDKDAYGIGLPVVRSKQLPTWAEFEIDVPSAGQYDLRVRCASEAPRPVTAYLNGLKITEGFCGLTTGGYTPVSQKWQTAGVHEFPKGKVRLRLESPNPFPHISTIALVPWERKK
jgi:hypothetical protein